MKKETLFTRTPIILNHGLTFMMPFTLKYLVRGTISNIATKGITLPHMNFRIEGHKICSITLPSGLHGGSVVKNLPANAREQET